MQEPRTNLPASEANRVASVEAGWYEALTEHRDYQGLSEEYLRDWLVRLQQNGNGIITGDPATADHPVARNVRAHARALEQVLAERY